jgi:succinate dehydrogenase / fumarate reductase cytochrome b subunit
MHWTRHLFTSSIGQKLTMSLTGIFLIIFLVVHLSGNLQLLANDDGEAFNKYTYFMTHNPVIKVISFGLYFFILLHAVQGIVLWVQNRKSRSTRYARGGFPKASWAAKRMALLGLLVFAFLMLHMGDFWYKLKFTDQVGEQLYASMDHAVKDLYVQVAISFKEPWIIAAYMVGLIALFIHLWHGFDSAFQTLGWKHKKYGYLIRNVGRIYSIIITAGFAIIPLYYYFLK